MKIDLDDKLQRLIIYGIIIALLLISLSFFQTGYVFDIIMTIVVVSLFIISEIQILSDDIIKALNKINGGKK
jgi:hypothetical protein